MGFLSDFGKTLLNDITKKCKDSEKWKSIYRNMSYEELKSEYKSGSWKTPDSRRFAFQAICKEKISFKIIKIRYLVRLNRTRYFFCK